MRHTQPRSLSGRCQVRTPNKGKCFRHTNLIANGEWRCDLHLKGRTIWQAMLKFESVDA